jgi:shikimate kinase/3-dehydroquinate synthase
MPPGGSVNLILTGFMGTGKTSVGRELARRLGRPFVDMDTEIEARAGKPIPHIFAQDGEATFRQMESALCKELSARQGLVVATGGGALVDPANRAQMMGSGTVVCLTCDAGEILRRVTQTGNADRPLLNVADPRTEIERLLEKRRQAYAAIPWQVDTTRLSIEEVAKSVIALAGTVTLLVRHPGGEYPIHIGPGVLPRIGEALRGVGVAEGSRVAVVTNPVVAPLYGAQVEASLRAAGLQSFVCSVTDGEQHKTLASAAALYEQFLANGLGRSGTVVSLGGGVIGDLAGFAAATFMRGLRFVQVPTTLLAMTDASVGGKTGVDLPQGKNLVGAFKQPALVAIDPAVLTTLPPEEIRSGLAEVIKHGVIGAPDLFAELETGGGDLASWWEGEGVTRLARSLRVKVAVVEEDPFESGRRAVLNLGHTVGHGLERLSDFTLRHGAAVSIGMVAAARLASRLGHASPALADRIEASLASWELPVRLPPFSPSAIWEAMAHDKKRQGRSLRWVLPCALGDVFVTDQVSRADVLAVLKSLKQT